MGAATSKAGSTSGEEVFGTQSKQELHQFPKEGVRLSHLDEFIRACGGKSELEGLTTTDVCEKFIKPWTFETQTSFCEWLSLQEHPAVGKANVFISHAWQCQFLDVMEAIVTHLREDGHSNGTNSTKTTAQNDPIIWFCLFSNNQHKVAAFEFEWFSETFQSAVADIGRTIMVMSPWDDPLPFTRAWCILEVYATAVNDCPFEIAMSENDRLKFLDDVTKDTDGATKRMMATIRAENSQCFREEDQARIFDVIQQTIGFSKINSMVFDKYREWGIKASTEACLQSMSTVGLLYQGQGKYCQAEVFLEDCYRKAGHLLGFEHPRTMTFSDNLARLYMDQGKYKTAHPLINECLTRRKSILGDDHRDTLASMNDSARCLMATWDYGEAQSLLEVCLSKTKAARGEDHPETLSAMNRLGSLFMKSKQYSRARPLFEDCYQRRKRTLGEHHLDTLASTNNLAVLYKRQEDYEKAHELLHECLSKRKEILGEDHPSTLTIMNNLAALETERGEYEKAHALMDVCCERRSLILGKDHPDTVATIDNLDVLSHRLGKQTASQTSEDDESNASAAPSSSSIEDGFDELSYCSSHKSRSSRGSSRHTKKSDSQKVDDGDGFSLASEAGSQSGATQPRRPVLPSEIEIADDDSSCVDDMSLISKGSGISRQLSRCSTISDTKKKKHVSFDSNDEGLLEAADHVAGSTQSETKRRQDASVEDSVDERSQSSRVSQGELDSFLGRARRSRKPFVKKLKKRNSSRSQSSAEKRMPVHYEDGDLCDGKLQDENKHETRTMKFGDGRVFVGLFLNGEMVEGKMTYPSGETYEGSRKYGKGKCIFPDKSEYVGEFKDGQIHGHGKMMLGNGGWYEGEWSEGERHGQGKEVNADGSIKHEGLWSRNNPVEKDT